MNRRRSQLGRMRGDVPGVAWPPLFSTRTASLAAAAQQFEASQWLDGEEIARNQFRQLAVVARHVAIHSPLFRERLEQAGLTVEGLATLEGLSRLPPLTRQQVQSTGRPIHIDALPEGHAPVHQVNTSGSTGEPVIVRRTAINRLHWLALTLRYHLWSEPDFSGRICAIRANMKSFGEDKDWGAPASLFFDTGPGLRIDIELDVSRQIAMLREFRPNSLIVYPSNLAAILDELDAKGLDLPGLERLRTIGETLAPDLRMRAAERLGVRLFDCYSSEEFGYIALQCPDGELYHVMSETLIVEVVDGEGRPCGEGDTGRVLVTDLHNHATPMVRYAIGDYAEVGPQCPCGRGLPTLKAIVGRERNMIVRPDGTRHWPLTGYKRYREIAPIVQYQMRQHAPDRIEVRMVVERPLTQAEEAALTAWLHEKLRYPFRLDFIYFEGRLPAGPNGKFEEFMRLF